MARVIQFALLGCLSLFPLEVEASSVTLKFHEQIADKAFSIESGLEVLTNGKLSDEGPTVEIDPLLESNATRVKAMVTITGHREYALGINLFRCDTRCRFQVVMGELASPNSRRVEDICKQPQDTIEGLFQKYFFCRLAYLGHLAAEGACWPEAKQALSGWFDAAYLLHINTLKEGTAFVARDKVAESYVRDAQVACENFEGSVRNIGYFGGMLRELDRATLQATRRVERLLKAGEPDAAKRWAETIVEEIGGTRSIRGSLPDSDVAYVEAILNRALQTEPRYTLP
jgi:hypothetical protein